MVSAEACDVTSWTVLATNTTIASLLTGLDIEVYLTPRAGVRDRRRISAIAFTRVHGEIDWRKIDEALATLNSLGALQVVFFVLDGGDEREEYLKDIAPSMPFLTRSPILKFALKSQNSEHNHLCTQAVLKDGEFHAIGAHIQYLLQLAELMCSPFHR